MEQRDLSVLEVKIVDFLVRAKSCSRFGSVGWNYHVMAAGLVVGAVGVEAKSAAFVADEGCFEVSFRKAAGE